MDDYSWWRKTSIGRLRSAPLLARNPAITDTPTPRTMASAANPAGQV